MSVLVIPLNKICPRCKESKSYNDDFHSHLGQKDYKQYLCKKCRAETRKPSKPTDKSRRASRLYSAERRKYRLLGENLPITPAEQEELALWLKYPDIWVHESEFRTKNIKEDLKATINKLKKESQWIPESKPEDYGEFSEAIMWLESCNCYEGIEESCHRTKTSLRRILFQIKYYSKYIAPGLHK